MGRGTRNVGRDPKDRYATPAWCIRGLVGAFKESACLSMPGAGAFTHVVDIGSGDGRVGFEVAAWLRGLGAKLELHLIEPFPPAETVAMDGPRIHYQEEFQAHVAKFGGRPPWTQGGRTLIVSNPSFSQSEAIVEMAVTTMRKECAPGSWAFFLLRMDWRAATTRARGIMRRHPLAVEFTLSPRPSFCVGPSGSKTDFYNYAWHGWAGAGVERQRWGWPIVNPDAR
jgi:hypothetical protein